MTTRTITQTFTTADTFAGPQEAIAMEAMIVATTTIAGVIASGTATYGVEVTMDDVNDTTMTPLWFPLDGMPAGTSTTKYVGFTEPFQFVRINISAIAGELQFKMLQSFNQL